jgi:hypothetical protein
MSERRLPWSPSARAVASNFKPLLNERNGPSRLAQLLDGADSVLGEAVRLALESGSGVLLSPTRDGGALSITLYLGDDRLRGYAASPEEFTALLDRVADVGRGTVTPGKVNPASNALGIRKGP